MEINTNRLVKRIKVKPGAFKNELLIDDQGNWTVRLKAKPINGEANEALVIFLAKELKVSKSNISIEKGTTSQYKTISITQNSEK